MKDSTGPSEARLCRVDSRTYVEHSFGRRDVTSISAALANHERMRFEMTDKLIDLLTPLMLARYWAKVDKRATESSCRWSEGICWKWIGANNSGGYGVLNIAGKNRYASHIAMAIDGFEKPGPGAQACHACDNPWCVNPDHLRWGDPTANALDMMRRARSGTAKLTDRIVRVIRASEESNATLARRYKVTISTIVHARAGKSWTLVEPGADRRIMRP